MSGFRHSLTGETLVPLTFIKEDSVRNFTTIIVGGGPHGVMLLRQLQARGAQQDEIAIVDSRPLLHWWRERLHDCDTQWLRSGPEHHVDAPVASSLRSFARERGREDEFATDAHRPMVSLFNDHASHVIERSGLERQRIAAVAHGFSRLPNGTLLLRTSEGSLATRHLVLATGPGGPFYPRWATRLGSSRVCHIFDQTFERSSLEPGCRVILIGGGISGVQVALALAEAGHQVTVLTRRVIGVSATTTPEDWTAARLAQMTALPYEQRFEMLQGAGDKGTLPSWEQQRLAEALRSRTIVHRVCNIESIRSEGADVCVYIAGGRPDVERAHTVVLGTGFIRDLPEWLRTSARNLNLPLTPSGAPILEPSLEWGTGSCIYLMGAGSAPVLGPYAANLIGGMLGSERIAVSIVSESSCAPRG
ncbi:MAG: SidA/IucD/PvdA family monooxygenase [Bdellovibrionales bacterium]|nr:SidA/IucD/PvdA family monooxygenase [Bdellovibrionales bacterium]